MRLSKSTLHRLAVLALVAWAGSLPLAAAEAQAEGDLAKKIEQRYEVRDLRDSILLRPRVEGGAVRSIEITDDDEVLVNGKDFTPAEIEAFLGADGELVRSLAELDREARRKALGLWTEPDTAKARRHEGIDIQVPGVPRPPRVRVRVSGDDRVSIGHSIQLAEGEYAHDVVCVLCSVDILGETSGDAVAVLGSVHVAGRVGGNAAAILGSVVVEDGAEVNGDGVSIGGGLETHGTGRIHGQNTQVGVGSPWAGGWSRGWGFPWSVFSDTGRLIAAMLRAGLLALLAVATVLVARPSVDLAARRVAQEPWKAAFAGLLAQLLFLPVLVLAIVILAVSIVGIPLLVLVPFALLALLVGMFVGFVGVARNLGVWAEGRFGWKASSVALSVVVGVVLIQALSLAGRLLSIPGGWFAVVGFTLVGLGFFLKYVAWTTGFGAMTLAVLSGEWRRSARATIPPPPPPSSEPRELEPVTSAGDDSPFEEEESREP